MDAQITIQRPEPTEDQAHIDAMVAKVDGSGATEDTSTPTATAPKQRPEGIPEKFWDAEKGEVKVDDLAKSYSELESKQGAGKKPEGAPEEKPEGETEGATDAVAAKELASKGLDLNDFSQEFNQKGELSPESYEKLDKAGYPKAIVDQYIAGQKALASQYESEVKAVAGGEEQFAAVVAWAAENLTEQEKIAYNKAIDSGDMAQAKLALSGVTAKYQQAYPSEGNLLGGKPVGGGGGDSYESLAQMQEDMASPKYKTDPAFRKMVEQKIGRSKII